MTDRPILFSAPEIRAMLDGRKHQTRRIIKPQPATFHVEGMECEVALVQKAGDPLPRIRLDRVITLQEVRFAKGDRLWVRETWKPHSIYAAVKPRDIPASRIFYAAEGGSFPSNTPWRPGIHMPRWASRLTLTVTDVRVERLQEISEADAEAEGAYVDDSPCDHSHATCDEIGCLGQTHKAGFCNVWSLINGTLSWLANPWVVAISFTVERRNIDA